MGWDRKICIVGADESDDLGRAPRTSQLALHAQAAVNALRDCGLSKADVDGILGVEANQVAEYLQIIPKYIDTTSVGGCSFMIHVEHAAAAIAAGLCEVALITHGESGYSRIGARGWGRDAASPTGQFEVPYGTGGAPTTFSLPVLRHMKDFGTTFEQLAEVSVATRKWASLNPKAFMRDPITIEDVLNSRWIAYPYRLLNCCLVCDGGGALVVTTAERAARLGKRPVYLLGSGESTEHWMISQMADFTTSASAVTSGRRAFEMAGVEHKDVDHVMFYDAFSFTPMLMLEDLGFCGRGESGKFVENQRTAPGGDFPMNTNGGGLSYCHTGMYGMFAIIESVRQLRGECGERQVPGVKVSLCHGPGGSFAAAGTLILGL